MKKLLLITLIVAIPMVGWTQMQPMFQTSIFFEDSLGNRDTIVVGYDTSANIDFNPLLGELNLTAPFDSVFEVRAAHGLDYGWGEGDFILSKTIIGNAEQYLNAPECFLGEFIIFFIHAVHQPVKIRWEMDVFNNICNKASFFTPDKMYELAYPWDWFEMPNIRYRCASKDSLYEISLGDAFRAPYEIPYAVVWPVQGSDVAEDSIFGVSLFPGANMGFSPCSLISAEHELDNISVFHISPNPTIGQVFIRQDVAAPSTHVFVYDVFGKTIDAFYLSEYAGTETVYDMSRLPNGFYLFLFKQKNDLVAIKKIYKQF